MVFKFQHRLAAAAVMAALAVPALAQPTTTTPAAPTAGATASEGRHARPAGERRDHHERRQAYRAKRMAELKAQLKLTSAQEPAWTAFTTALQPSERPARLDHKDMDKLTTPERIDRMRALRAQHAAEADRRGEATKTFYAALTPEQQKTFDAKAPRHHRGPHGQDGHHGRDGKDGKDGERHHRGDTGKPAPAAPPAAPAK